MALHQGTAKLTPAQNNAIPPGKYIGVDERFLLKPEPYVAGQHFGRGGKDLIPYGFSFGHQNPDLTPVYQPAPQMTQNFGTYIYNSVTGYY
tara:strand:- start:1304 stop:1576 length:273 start_codon:yes stop_codon:yes gene_type:complete